MIDSYITIPETSCEEIIVSKSRFISYAAPCQNEEEAISFLQQIHEIHKTARHHCYAYIIGENSGVMRYSDDGEPGGTAGMPIMDTMRKKSIVNCCIIVVRYFGGILLGTGGLVRAYTQAAQAALESAGTVRMEMTCEELCELPYSVWNKFRYAAERLPVKIDQIEYGNNVLFHLFIRTTDRTDIMIRLMDASERKLESVPCQESFHAWKI